jgi:DNA-binding transcriptional ArsR family regulator
MDEIPKRAPVFLVDNLETLKVMTDPTRIEILHILASEPQTINQVAEKLGLTNSRLYYHFKQLEDHGLISVVNTRMVNNIVEKFYWSTAEDFDIDTTLLDFSSDSGKENIERLVSSSLETTRMDMLRTLQARREKLNKGAASVPREMVITNIKKRLKDETFEVFINRLKELLEEFSKLPEEVSEGEDINQFSLAVYAYPNYYYDQGQEANE